MARKRPSRTFRIDKEVCESLEKKMATERRKEDLGVYIENKLDLLAHDRLVDIELYNQLKAFYEDLRSDLRAEIRNIHAARVKGSEEDEQRKIS